MSNNHRSSDSEQHESQLSSNITQTLQQATPNALYVELTTRAATLSPTAIDSFSGAMAGVASGIVTCPLDVIKTKLQAQGGFRPRGTNPISGETVIYRGLVPTASMIVRQDGLKGLYRGLGPMLLGYLPTWAVYMSVYGAAKDYLYPQMADNKLAAQVLASIAAGATSTVVTNPIWVIKTRLMSQVGPRASKEARTPWHYLSTLDAAKKMYRTEGIRAFYSGLAPALLGLSHVAIQFPLYEALKFQFTGLEMGGYSRDDHRSHTLGILAATFLSKVCATTATYPHEVLRTRLQTQQRQRALASSDRVQIRYSSVWHTCKTILAEEGWRSFYYGMGTNLIRAVPSAMTTMLTYETLKRAINTLQYEGRLHLQESG